MLQNLVNPKKDRLRNRVKHWTTYNTECPCLSLLASNYGDKKYAVSVCQLCQVLGVWKLLTAGQLRNKNTSCKLGRAGPAGYATIVNL